MASLPTVILDRARGVLLGLAVGDALGGPLEFLSAEETQEREGGPVRDFIGGGWLSLEPGHGTDDTAMALALARSAATSIGYDPGRALAAYLEWFGSDPLDVGGTIRHALAAADAGIATAVATEELHRRTGRTAGNGSLMRIAPIALRHVLEPERRVRAARTDSNLTHFDDYAADACAWLCDAIVALLEGVHPSELAPPAVLDAAWAITPEAAAAAASGPTAGYVGTGLGVASVALRTAGSFEEGLVWAINLGGDADTNGAITGALLGARFGASVIPERWLELLAVREEATALAERLVSLAQAGGQRRGGGRSGLRAGGSSDAGARLNAALEPYASRLRQDPEARLAAEATISACGVFREGSMLVSNVPDRDALYVLERPYFYDGLEPDREVEICENVRLVLDLDSSRCVGFWVGGLSEFDFEAPENRAIWMGPRFDVPALGVEEGTIGLVAATARLVLGGLRTPDRVWFDAAVQAKNRAEALELWEACLAEGNELARLAVGYTLVELGRAEEAHEHLKRYSAYARRNSWAWCWLGQACEALANWEGAEYAYRQALDATTAGSFDTDAADRLAALLARLAKLRPGVAR